MIPFDPKLSLDLDQAIYASEQVDDPVRQKLGQEWKRKIEERNQRMVENIKRAKESVDTLTREIERAQKVLDEMKNGCEQGKNCGN